MPHERFTEADLEAGCDDLAMMRFWPSDARASVMRLLAAMCPHREALRWLVAECVNHVPQWPGAAELRGLLSTRYTPADGVLADCGIPGYRPCDYEARYLEQHEQLKAQERVGGFMGEGADMLRQLSERVPRMLPAREDGKEPKREAQ